MKILVTESQLKNILEDIMDKDGDIEYAVIEITKPIAHMKMENYYQKTPLWKTKGERIYINRGSAGGLSISTKNIKVLKTFKSDNDELKEYLKNLREKHS